jgi:hypothetical protein
VAQRKTFEDVLNRLVKTEAGCWLWPGELNEKGYGKVDFEGRKWRVHRLVYTHLRGPIPAGLELDHLCRVNRCANPDHLEALTRQEHAKRHPRSLRRRSHCRRGHPLVGDNLYVRPTGSRVCRTCSQEAVRRYRARQREQG